MASGTGIAQLTQTSRDWAIAFAVSQERDEAFRIKVETSQMEMERAMMEKAEMETRFAGFAKRFEDDREEWRFQQRRTNEDWLQALAEADELRLELEVHRRTLRLQGVELPPARILW